MEWHWRFFGSDIIVFFLWGCPKVACNTRSLFYCGGCYAGKSIRRFAPLRYRALALGEIISMAKDQKSKDGVFKRALDKLNYILSEDMSEYDL